MDRQKYYGGESASITPLTDVGSKACWGGFAGLFSCVKFGFWSISFKSRNVFHRVLFMCTFIWCIVLLRLRTQKKLRCISMTPSSILIWTNDTFGDITLCQLNFLPWKRNSRASVIKALAFPVFENKHLYCGHSLIHAFHFSAWILLLNPWPVFFFCVCLAFFIVW